MSRLTLVALAAVAACSSPRAPERPLAATAYRVVDATDAYVAFVDSLPGIALDRRVAAFRERVVSAHPELFADNVIGIDPTRKDADLDARLATYLPSLVPERADGIHRVAKQIHTTLGEQDASFRRAFPDMKWSGTIYFTASIDAFDGALRDVAGGDGKKERALLFGIDKIVKIYGADARIGPLFHHELFHCYHVDVNPHLQSTDDSHGMLEPLWSEGLAVYVASRLNPGATLRELTLSDEMVRAADARLPATAAEMRGLLDDMSEATYRDFFLGAGKREDIPKRVAYYVGWRVAQKVAEGHGGNLAELARLARPALRTEVDAALASLK